MCSCECIMCMCRPKVNTGVFLNHSPPYLFWNSVIYFVYVCLCFCILCMWRSVDNFEELVVLGSVQAIRLAGGHLCLVNHSACLFHFFFFFWDSLPHWPWSLLCGSRDPPSQCWIIDVWYFYMGAGCSVQIFMLVQQTLYQLTHLYLVP